MDLLIWLPALAGAALVLVSLVDIGLTVLHIQAESPISNASNRWIWRVMAGATQALPAALRDSVLAWGVPLLTGTTIGFWAVLNVAGFGLLYTPMIHRPGFFVSSDAATDSALVDALYFSGASFFTTGYGDFAPLHPLPRLLAIVEGAFGLLTISLAVTYLLSVYPAITRTIALAVSLNQETAGRADGVAMAERYLSAGCANALGDRLRRLNDELLLLTQAHSFYPLLFYARPREVHESFARVLALVQGIVATLRYGLDPQTHREVVGDPRLRALEEGLLHTLHTLQRSSHLAPHAEWASQRSRSRTSADTGLEALASSLTAAGLTPVRLEAASVDAYRRFQEATEPYIDAYAHNARYARGDVWATYSRWARDADLVSNES